MPRCYRPWSKREEDQLSASVELYGKDWKKISRIIGNGRLPEQCQRRWINHHDPEIDRSPWTPQEDKKLLAWAKLRGGQQLFSEYARANLKGRAADRCYSRYQSLLKVPGRQTKPTRHRIESRPRAVSAAGSSLSLGRRTFSATPSQSPVNHSPSLGYLSTSIGARGPLAFRSQAQASVDIPRWPSIIPSSPSQQEDGSESDSEMIQSRRSLAVTSSYFRTLSHSLNSRTKPTPGQGCRRYGKALIDDSNIAPEDGRSHTQLMKARLALDVVESSAPDDTRMEAARWLKLYFTND